jgi:glutamyl-tRNA reductase
MENNNTSKHHYFYAVGLSYKSAEIRGKFSLMLLQKCGCWNKLKMEEFNSHSTCNRTEIYGYAEHPFQLIKLICEKGSVEAFQKVGFV